MWMGGGGPCIGGGPVMGGGPCMGGCIVMGGGLMCRFCPCIESDRIKLDGGAISGGGLYSLS